MKDEIEGIIKDMYKDRQDLISVVNSLTSNKQSIESLQRENKELSDSLAAVHIENNKNLEQINQLTLQVKEVPVLRAEKEILVAN